MTAKEFLIREDLPLDFLSGDDVQYVMVEFAKYYTEIGMRYMATIASPFGNQGLSKQEKESLDKILNSIK